MFFQKYAHYRKLLYGCMLFNGALIMLGVVAAVRFIRDEQLRNAEMMFVGLGVLVFGIILPLVLIRKIDHTVKAWEIDAKNLVAEWLTVWAEAKDKHRADDSILTDVALWVNVTLVGLQSLKGKISNPYFQFFTEVAGLVRESLKETHEVALVARPTKAKKRKRKITRVA